MDIAPYNHLKRVEQLARLSGHAEVAEERMTTGLERVASARWWYALLAAAAIIATFVVWQMAA